ncbi:MAG: VOC family protein [Anaerolineae bacterium]|nr:VOC family protein [Anaerolineae bacterium]
MSTEGIGTHIVTQIAIVVKDIEKTCEAYSRILGLPVPPVSETGGESARATYRGKPMLSQAKLAFFHLGQVSLELIQPLGGDSVWQEVLDEKGEGVHHIAFNVKGTNQVTAYLAEHDVPVIQQGHYPGGMYTYVDSESQLAVMLELLENFDE